MIEISCFFAVLLSPVIGWVDFGLEIQLALSSTGEAVALQSQDGNACRRSGK